MCRAKHVTELPVVENINWISKHVDYVYFTNEPECNMYAYTFYGFILSNSFSVLTTLIYSL